MHFTFRGTLLQLLSRIMVVFCVSDTEPNLEPDRASFGLSLTRIGMSSHFLVSDINADDISHLDLT